MNNKGVVRYRRAFVKELAAKKGNSEAHGQDSFKKRL
jgi:hypothetical protein